VPSEILGQIRADGQVYLINRNGIIFGGSSQVNVGTLVASALPINDALLNAGVLFSNPNSSFKLLGNGALTQEQQKNLTDEERGKLRQLERSNAL
jgi:large exoprotein involved in heme utilization and adhesion